MKIFDQTIRIRDYICSPTGGYVCGNSRVNFYIYASGLCPAHCSFCPGFNSKTEIDFEKLGTVLQELHNKKVINRIAITGGEPLINLDRFDRILETISDVCGNEYHVSVNTNGTNLGHLENINHSISADYGSKNVCI